MCGSGVGRRISAKSLATNGYANSGQKYMTTKIRGFVYDVETGRLNEIAAEESLLQAS